MSIRRLLFMALFAVSVGGAGCGEEIVPGRGAELCDDEFEPTPTCEAFCETSVELCQSIPTIEECVQVCECQLAGAREISSECEEALASGFSCGAELDCPAFMDFVTRIPAMFPCMAEAAEVERSCGLDQQR